MKRIISQVTIVFAIAFIIGSCGKEKGKKYLPNIKGKAGEVVVVLSKEKWKGEAGEAIREILMGAETGLPHPEPMFSLVNVTREGFGDVFITHRNIMFVELSENQESPKLTIRKDVWARAQIVIGLKAKNYLDLKDLLQKNKDKIITLLKDAERKRLVANYKKNEEKKIRDYLVKKHSISLIVPAGYKIDVDTNSFIWISQETTQISQGIFIYYYNYTDTNTFTFPYLIEKRDTFLKKYVPGPSPGSYMSTEKKYPPELTEFMLGNRYIAMLKGLWKVENDFMGGPFISFTTLDEKRNRIVTVEGFVYAPQFNKRNYIRQLEAILYSIEIP